MAQGLHDAMVADHLQKEQKEAKKYDFLKILFLWAAFFCVIGSYTIIKELKNSIFAYVVGREYLPLVRFLSMFVLIPPIFLYSKLVDSVHRYWLVCGYSIFFSIMGFVFAYFVGHPEIGLANTDSNKYRLFGWLFYCVIEGFSPFVVSVFWAFANSVNSPEGARKNYGWMVSGSKLGGLLSAGLAWYILGFRNSEGGQLYTDVINHQGLLISSSVMLLMVPIIILIMVKKIPGRYLHGYEAVYQVEKEKKKQGKEQTGVFAGLQMLFKYPYVMGIFGMLFFYEVCGTVLSYLRIGAAQEHSNNATEALRYLLEIIFYTQTVGFFISLFGTSWLFNKLGTRKCLMLVPITAGIALLYYILNLNSPQALLIASVMLHSINYAFSWPLRETLYIPAVKEIKFKSKAWIDAFGGKFAKTSGSAFNLLVVWLGSNLFFASLSCFFGIAVFLWGVTAYLLGKRFDQAVKNNEVIGVDLEDE